MHQEDINITIEVDWAAWRPKIVFDLSQNQLFLPITLCINIVFNVKKAYNPTLVKHSVFTNKIVPPF